MTLKERLNGRVPVTKGFERLSERLPIEVAQRLALAEALERGDTIPTVLRGGTVAKGAETFDEERGTGIFQITTPTVDRFDDVVVPEGLDNTNYRKNPVVLWNHDDSRPPIGKSLAEEVHPEGVLSEVQFDLRNDPKGEHAQIFGQYVDGVLNADSIRFLPITAEKRMVEDKETGAEAWGGGFTYAAWELLEHSAVPLPANPDALALAAPAVLTLAKRAGVLDARLAEQLDIMGVLDTQKALQGQVTELTEALEKLKAALPNNGLAAGVVAPTATDRGEAATIVREAVDLERALQILNDLGDTLRGD